MNYKDDDHRMFSLRLMDFARRMNWRRLEKGILEPAWLDQCEDEVYALITTDK